MDAGRPRTPRRCARTASSPATAISPLELRKLARAELEAYPEVRVIERGLVSSLALVEPDAADAGDGMRFRRGAGEPRPRHPRPRHRALGLVATGLRETLPAIPSLRAFYGMTLFSCAACDGWELRDRPLALIGETPTSPTAPCSSRGGPTTSRSSRTGRRSSTRSRRPSSRLAASGRTAPHRRPRGRPRRGHRRAARRRIAGRDRRRLRAPAVAPGTRLPRRTSTLDLDADGHLVVDRSGRTSDRRDSTGRGMPRPRVRSSSSSPQAGARVAAVLVHDQLGVRTAH